MAVRNPPRIGGTGCLGVAGMGWAPSELVHGAHPRQLVVALWLSRRGSVSPLFRARLRGGANFMVLRPVFVDGGVDVWL